MGKSNARSARSRQSPTKQRKPVNEPKKPIWRRPVAWLASLGTAVLVGVLVNVLSTQAQRIAPSPASGTAGQTQPSIAGTSASAPGTHSGAPVRIDSVTIDNSVSTGIYIFPKALVLSAGELKSLNSLSLTDPRYDSWFTS